MKLSDLNTQQKMAVTAKGGAHLLVAGAGTGKTRTLVHRVAWLIEQGVSPTEIVLLTFTKRAAHEMLQRASEIIGPKAKKVRGGTFHGFANITLRRFASQIGFSSDFTILDRADAESMLGMIRVSLGYGGKGRRFAKKGTVLKILSKHINKGASVEEILEEEYPQYLPDKEKLQKIFSVYKQQKQQNNVMDFDDLLVFMAQLLRESEKSRLKISSGIRHVLVDEYQDTNTLQGFISCMLSCVHGNLMVVGDEAQSIYGFRGANIQNILDFPKLFPKCSITLLEQNYRSKQSILDLANGILESSAESFEKRLFSSITSPDLPQLIVVETEIDQPQFIVQQILNQIDNGVSLNEMAVLFRSSHHSNLIEVELASANLPFEKFGGIQFTESAHIKDVFALLKLIANPRDSLSWFRVLNWFDGIGEKTANRLTAEILAQKPLQIPPHSFANKKYGEGLRRVNSQLQKWRAMDDLISIIDDVLGYYLSMLNVLYDDGIKRSKDLEALKALAPKYKKLNSFLADLTLEPLQASRTKKRDSEDEFLTLSTIHSAKGLEWKIVFIVNLGDGSFPVSYAIEDEVRMEEERRLLYVAVTRAKDYLYLLNPQYIHGRWGRAIAPECSLLESVANLNEVVERIELDFDSVESDSEEEAVDTDPASRFVNFFFPK